MEQRRQKGEEEGGGEGEARKGGHAEGQSVMARRELCAFVHAV